MQFATSHFGDPRQRRTEVLNALPDLAARNRRSVHISAKNAPEATRPAERVAAPANDGAVCKNRGRVKDAARDLNDLCVKHRCRRLTKIEYIGGLARLARAEANDARRALRHRTLRDKPKRQRNNGSANDMPCTAHRILLS
jgi:hypothetical protein